jgi:hypothetical protein
VAERGIIMNKQKIQRIQRIIANANASLKMEGLKPSSFALELAQKQLEGKISSNQVTQLILDKYLK